MSSRACERQIHVRALRATKARGPVPGSHTPFPAQQITTEAQGSAGGRFAEPGLYRYLSIVDLPCFSWLTRMFWRWCACNTTSRLLCRGRVDVDAFLVPVSISTYPSRSPGGIWSASALRRPRSRPAGAGDGAGCHSMRERWVVWMVTSEDPARPSSPHPPENACKYRLRARASKLVKHRVLHYGDALLHWTARALTERGGLPGLSGRDTGIASGPPPSPSA